MRRLLLAVEDLMQYPHDQESVAGALRPVSNFTPYTTSASKTSSILCSRRRGLHGLRPLCGLSTTSCATSSETPSACSGRCARKSSSPSSKNCSTTAATSCTRRRPFSIPTSMAMISPKEFEEMKGGRPGDRLCLLRCGHGGDCPHCRKGPGSGSRRLCGRFAGLVGQIRLHCRRQRQARCDLPVGSPSNRSTSSTSICPSTSFVCRRKRTRVLRFRHRPPSSFRAANVIGREVMNCHPQEECPRGARGH